MIIPIENPEIILTPEQQERSYWDNLRFNSHRWEEYSQGYYKCSFCESMHTSMMPINFKKLCEKNPYIKP